MPLTTLIWKQGDQKSMEKKWTTAYEIIYKYRKKSSHSRRAVTHTIVRTTQDDDVLSSTTTWMLPSFDLLIPSHSVCLSRTIWMSLSVELLTGTASKFLLLDASSAPEDELVGKASSNVLLPAAGPACCAQIHPDHILTIPTFSKQGRMTVAMKLSMHNIIYMTHLFNRWPVTAIEL